MHYYRLWSPCGKIELQNLFLLCNWNFAPFNQYLSILSYPLHWSPWSPPFCFLLLSLTFLDSPLLVKSYSICLSMTGLFSRMSSRFIYIIARDRLSFFLRAEWYSLICEYFLSIHSSMDTQVGSLSWLLWIMMEWTWNTSRYLIWWLCFLWICTHEW
jgi:hypothetical protein